MIPTVFCHCLPCRIYDVYISMSFKKLYVHVLCVTLCNRQDVQISMFALCASLLCYVHLILVSFVMIQL